jgi:hypothetical protein
MRNLKILTITQKSRRQLDSHSINYLQRRPAYSQRHHAVAGRLSANRLANCPDILGRLARVFSHKCFWCQVPRSDQQNLHILDSGQCADHSGDAPELGQYETQWRIRLQLLRCQSISKWTIKIALGGDLTFHQGWPDGWAFFVGLLQAAYTLTGYGLVASM